MMLSVFSYCVWNYFITHKFELLKCRKVRQHSLDCRFAFPIRRLQIVLATKSERLRKTSLYVFHIRLFLRQCFLQFHNNKLRSPDKVIDRKLEISTTRWWRRGMTLENIRLYRSMDVHALFMTMATNNYCSTNSWGRTRISVMAVRKIQDKLLVKCPTRLLC